MSTKLETDKLAEMLKKKRGARGLRDIAKEITKMYGEISPSTLSRIEQGNMPDIDTYVTVCQWLDVPTSYFTKDNKKESSTTQELLAHLRADKNLPADTATALVTMITLAYESLGKNLPKKNANR